MTLLAAYADVTEYRARVRDLATGGDLQLSAQLLAGSRLVERSLGVSPGGWNSDTVSVARTFMGDGSELLDLIDGDGMHYLRSVPADGIEVDADGDGVYEYAFTIADDWCIGLPENAAAFSRPYVALALLPVATLTAWPERRRAVRITTTAWGWAAVPDGIVDLVCHVVADLRAGHRGGAALDLPSLDGAGGLLTSDTWRLWLELRRAFNERLPAVG